MTDAGPAARSPTPPRCSSPAATRARRARRSSPASRARGPLLVEIQALVAPSALGTPRRAVVGWDPNRLAMVLAVLEARGGLRLGSHDVYLNVAGGLRINEPAADLAVAAALVSSLTGVAAAARMRSISARSACPARSARSAQAQARLREAQKLGFARRPAAGGRRGDKARAPAARQRRVSATSPISSAGSPRPAERDLGETRACPPRRVTAA